MDRNTVTRIAYIISGFPVPSETFVYREVLGLRRMGLTIDVYAISGPTHENLAVMPPEARRLTEDVHYLSHQETLLNARPNRRLLRGLLLNQRLTREATLKARGWVRFLRGLALARLIARSGADRIHGHWPYSCQLGAVVHALTGIPFSISVHAHEVAHDSGHFPAVFEQIDFATFCNQAAMDYLLDRLPGDHRAKCHLIYHGVDFDRFPYLTPPKPAPSLRVISVGRLTATKGFDRLVRSVGRARDQGLDCSLTIVGDGSQREVVERLAGEMGLAQHVKVTGWVQPEEVVTELNRSHVFVLMASTSYHDGLPNVVLEAQAVGRPVIISPLPAAKEAVKHGETGFVLSSSDVFDEVVTHLRTLSEHPEKVAEMGVAGRARVLERYDADLHLRKLFDLLTKT